MKYRLYFIKIYYLFSLSRRLFVDRIPPNPANNATNPPNNQLNVSVAVFGKVCPSPTVVPDDPDPPLLPLEIISTSSPEPSLLAD